MLASDETTTPRQQHNNTTTTTTPIINTKANMRGSTTIKAYQHTRIWRCCCLLFVVNVSKRRNNNTATTTQQQHNNNNTYHQHQSKYEKFDHHQSVSTHPHLASAAPSFTRSLPAKFIISMLVTNEMHNFVVSYIVRVTST